MDFYNSIMNRKYISYKSIPNYNGTKTLLKNVLISEKDVLPEFYIDKKALEKWKYFKGAKK